MSEPFLAEIRMFAFNFAPSGWAFCNGQLLPIAQNQALFSVLGTIYGGNGRTSFALPDLRSRVPIHSGRIPGSTNRLLGSKGGTDSHVLTATEIPVHTHSLNATSADGNSPVPLGNVLAAYNNAYIEATVDPPPLVALREDSLTQAGSNQGHDNTQPSLAIRFAIALQGLFPTSSQAV